MNKSVIRYILGYILKIEALLLLLPILIAIIYREKAGYWYLLIALFCAVIGAALSWYKPTDFVFYLKEGCVATALSWIVLSLFGSLPFYLSGAIPSYMDALFETISGFTTTGATILSDVEALDRCHLMWRSFTHWIGGMGVLVFLLMIIPLSGGSHMNLMRAESPGPSVSKLKPKLKTTARILYLIYLGMTILEMLLLLVGGMPLFDTVCTAFGTAGTGGFGIKNDSIGGYSAYIQWVVTIFMILFGVNFNAYYYIMYRDWKKAFHIEEVRYYLLIITCASLIIFTHLVQTAMNTSDALRHSCFQVASIISSTGYATTDFNTWSETSRTILVMLMFIGACAGSTGGGIKVSRIVILIKSLGKELTSYIHPKIVKKINFEHKPVEHEVVRATNVYLVTFVLLFSASLFLVSLEDHDLITNFTAVTTTINNIGPGLDLVGPTANFGFFTPLSKLVLMFDMLAGRLELFPLLILCHPALWKEMFVQQHVDSRMKQNKNNQNKNKIIRFKK